MTPEAQIACDSVSFAYGRTPVLSNVDLRVARGERVGIIGPNGAGKTTLLNLLTGCLSPQRGSVLFEGRRLRHWGHRALAQRIATVPQASTLVFGHRVVDIVAMGRHPHQGSLQWSLGPEDRERVIWALERTDTMPLAARRFNELSGGEQQLVFIARALAQSTEVLLLDEPTAALDLRHQAQITEVLAGLHRDQGTTLIWIAHDLNLVGRLCTRLVLIARGGIASDGPPSEILTAEKLSEAYETEVIVQTTEDGRQRVELALSGLESGR